MDIEDYNEGVEIAEQLVSVMQTDGEKIYDLEQYAKLKDWLEKNPYSRNISERLSSETYIEQLCSDFNRSECNSGATHLINTIHKKELKAIRNRILKITVSAAAALIAVSFLIFTQINESSIEKGLLISQEIPKENILKNPIKPTLILGDGSNLDLTSLEETTNVGNHINTTKEQNKLIYLKKETPPSEIEYNTLFVPKSYTYCVELADGTTVHLNASSELKYPIEFNENTREVFLRGEAFFNVKKSNKPFIVIVNDIQIKVYGTKFNVNSYNPNAVKTALLDGSVGVSLHNNPEIIETLIKPNQLFTIDRKGNGSLRNVDATQYTAWLNGLIKGNSLEDLLRNVGKWYGVEFCYDDQIKDIQIEASLNNKRPLEEILKSIETIVDIKIIKKTENKYVIIEKK